MSDPILDDLMNFNRLLDDLTREATLNPEMRARFIADPKAVLSERGINLPATTRVIVHELDPNEKHFFLPPAVTLTPPDLKPFRGPRAAQQREPDVRPPGMAGTIPFTQG